MKVKQMKTNIKRTVSPRTTKPKRYPHHFLPPWAEEKALAKRLDRIETRLDEVEQVARRCYSMLVLLQALDAAFENKLQTLTSKCGNVFKGPDGKHTCERREGHAGYHVEISSTGCTTQWGTFSCQPAKQRTQARPQTKED